MLLALGVVLAVTLLLAGVVSRANAATPLVTSRGDAFSYRIKVLSNWDTTCRITVYAGRNGKGLPLIDETMEVTPDLAIPQLTVVTADAKAVTYRVLIEESEYLVRSDLQTGAVTVSR